MERAEIGEWVYVHLYTNTHPLVHSLSVAFLGFLKQKQKKKTDG